VKYFGRNGNQSAVDMVVDSDGVIYILGNSQKSLNARQQIYLAKANSRGQLLMDTLLTDIPAEAKDIEFTLNDELILVANQLDTVNGDMNLLVKKLSKNFMETGSKILWSKDRDPKNNSNPHKNEYVNSITALANGNFILTGYTDNVSSASGHQLDILNFQIDQSLNKVSFEWGELTGAGVKNFSKRVIEAIRTDPQPDTVRYMFGNVSEATDQNVWYGVLPKNGYGGQNSDNQTDEVFISPLTNDVVTGAIKYSSGYFLTSVATNASNNAVLKLYDLGFETLNPGGSSEVTSSFEWPLGTVSNANATVCKASVGFLVAADFAQSPSNTDILFLKLNDGLKNPVYFGGIGNDRASAIAELPDGRILILGTMQLGNPPAQYKVALIKVNSNGRFEE
jgi:hypothetical protein